MTRADVQSDPLATVRALLGAAGVGKAKRRAQEVVAGALHPVRRRRAQRMLAEAPAFTAYLFICHGNIYRSPFAQFLFEARLPAELAAGVEISSAGFVGPGRTTPPKAVSLAAERGIDLTPHRSCAIAYDRVGDETLVVVMDPRQERAIRRRVSRGHILVLGDLDPERVTSRTIVDPWKEEEVLRASYDRVERCVEALIRELGRQSPGKGMR